MIAIAVLANAASYFWLSEGWGITSLNDGLTRVGFPFLIFEKGGIDGRSVFDGHAAIKNSLLAISIAFAAALFTYVMARVRVIGREG